VEVWKYENVQVKEKGGCGCEKNTLEFEANIIQNIINVFRLLTTLAPLSSRKKWN
jgi:hypothetical protein